MPGSFSVETIKERIKSIASPLRRQLLLLAYVSGELRKTGKPVPVLIGGCALAYYSREVYFTADIDLACADREALGKVLVKLGFEVNGRYWVNPELNLIVEVPASSLIGEDAPLETVDLGDGLECMVIGIEDLLIDRMNACIHWKSSNECEMVELLIRQMGTEIDWEYLMKRAALPGNDSADEFNKLRNASAIK